MNSSFDRNLSTEDLLRRRATLLQRLHVPMAAITG